jgi:hypothetical protein
MIKMEVTNMFEKVLDYAQIACPAANWDALRSKILGAGNNCIRSIHTVVDNQYKVEFKANSEDIVKIERK